MSLPSLTLRMSGLAPAAHDRDGELALERGLDRGHVRRRFLVAPRRVLAERVAPPLLEVGEARPWPRARRWRRRSSDGGTCSRPTTSKSEVPSAWIVSARLVQAIGGVNCTNGGWFTRRGAGRPVRPPRSARTGPTSRRSRAAPGGRGGGTSRSWPRLASFTVVTPIIPPPEYPASTIWSPSTSIHAARRFAKRNRFSSARHCSRSSSLSGGGSS